MSLLLVLFVFSFITAGANQAMGNELTGYIDVEGRYFMDPPRLAQQEKHNVSVALQPEYYHVWENGNTLTVAPFFRYDSADNERSHGDIRELSAWFPFERWDMLIGVSRVFWGVTEIVHLVDIINQTDLVENIDGEDKLGQPMIRITLPLEMGSVTGFLLPYFRERTFPGPEGRLRLDIPIDTDHAVYESADEEHHLDFALRFSMTLGDLDLGLYHFRGTSREPSFRLIMNPDDSVQGLAPYYSQIDQTGLNTQLIVGNLLLKLEAIYRMGQENRFLETEDYLASTGGFEYSFIRFAGTAMDVGVIGEYAWDERGDASTTWYQNDVMAGLRVAANDAATTVLLSWFGYDLDDGSKIFSLEASRRLPAGWKIGIEFWSFFGTSREDPLHSLRDDSYYQLNLSYSF